MARLILLALALAFVAWLARGLMGDIRRALKRRAPDEPDELPPSALAGGRPDHPIDVRSPAVVESRAVDGGCRACGATLRVTRHTAETIDGQRLRVAHVKCVHCETRDQVYFRIVAPH